jgi:uncharacterized protein YxjI
MKKFIIEQKITAFANQYKVYDPDSGAGKGLLLAFAHQKRLAFREEVKFYEDESQTNLVFSIKAEKVMDIHGRFFISDANDRRLGAVRKAFQASLLRSTYELMDISENIVATVQERSLSLAVFRRIWNIIPYANDIPFLFKYHFDFIDPQTKEALATYDKTTRFRDHYILELKNDILLDKVGWQTIVAQAVLLDVLQGR